MEDGDPREDEFESEPDEGKSAPLFYIYCLI